MAWAKGSIMKIMFHIPQSCRQRPAHGSSGPNAPPKSNLSKPNFFLNVVENSKSCIYDNITFTIKLLTKEANNMKIHLPKQACSQSIVVQGANVSQSPVFS